VNKEIRVNVHSNLCFVGSDLLNYSIQLHIKYLIKLINTVVDILEPPLGTTHLCGDPTLHYTDVVVGRSSFIHLFAAVGNHKHSPIWELNVSGPQRLELYQLCLTDHSKHLKMN